jgi:hypothetical protein
MTIRHIAATIPDTTTDSVVKVWKNLNMGKHPKPDVLLTAEQVETLLGRMSEAVTKRPPEKAAAAAQLLEQYRAGMHQNGHKEYAPVANPGVKMLGPDQPFKAGAEIKPRTVKKRESVIHAFTVTPQPEPQPRKRFTWPQISMLDIVYLSTIATAVYGLWFTLREMGAAFAVPYCLISWHALRMAKNPASRKTAQIGVGAVVVLEILTFFVHLVLFNLRAVQAAKANILPFEYSFWGSTGMPFTIACIMAGLFSGAGIYAVSVTYSLTSEKHTAAQQAKAEADRNAAHVEELRAALEDAARQWAVASGFSQARPEFCERQAAKISAILSAT